jgi:hypothetical protein
VHIGDNAAHVGSPGDQPIQPRCVSATLAQRSLGQPLRHRPRNAIPAIQRQAPPTSNTNGG